MRRERFLSYFSLKKKYINTNPAIGAGENKNQEKFKIKSLYNFNE